MELTQIDALKCPSCGANLDGQPVDGVLTCTYCGSRFISRDAQKSAAAMAGARAGKTHYEQSFDTIGELVLWYCESLEDDAVDSLDYLIVGRDLTGHPKYRKAVNNFGIPEGESVYLIYDDTVFGSCKTGFAITDRHLCYNYSSSGRGLMDWNQFADCKVGKIEKGSYGIRLDDLNLTATSANVFKPLHKMLGNMHDQMVDDFFCGAE